MELKFSTLSGLRICHNIYPSWIDITTSEHNQEVALCLQELTSALPSQRLSQVHLLGSTSPITRVFHNFSQSVSLLRPYPIQCSFMLVVMFSPSCNK